MNKLNWYIHRLSAMSVPEIMHRVHEQLKRAEFRNDRRGWDAFDVGDGVVREITSLRHALLQPWSVDILHKVRSSVEAFEKGDFRLLGQQWPADMVCRLDPKLWVIDPCSGKYWPGVEAYCFDIDYRHREDYGDIKYVWEVNRLQFLQPIAAYAFQSQDSELYEKVLRILFSWMDANPPFRGVNWSSGIELAMRLATVAIVIACAPEEHSLSKTDRSKLRKLIAAHAYWLARYPSLYSSANNHLVAEGLGLLIAGVVCPDLPHAAKYLTTGRAILSYSPEQQFHLDGTGVEQSPTYTAFTIEMLVLGAVIDDSDWLSQSARQRLIAAGEHLKSLMDDAGNLPRIGDDDEGRVVACPPEREEFYVVSVLGALSSVLDAPGLAHPRQPTYFRDVLFGRRNDGTAPSQGIFTYETGGYSIVRETIAEKSMVLTFDHGPLGYLSISAHGHADALAIWLHLDDQPVLVDAGTYLYHSGGSRRDYFRSSGAHNTLEVNGQSQSVTAGAFNWRHKARARLVHTLKESNWEVSARHDGYLNRLGIEHERTVRRRQHGFVVEDRLIGKLINVPTSARFLLHPSIEAHLDGRAVRLMKKNSALLVLECSANCDLSLEFGNRISHASMYSPAFGTIVPATTIIISRRQMNSEPLSISFLIESSAQASELKERELLYEAKPFEEIER